MIERERGYIIFHCDGKRCAETLEADTGDFREALEALDEAGWVARRKAAEWLHVCDSCLEVEHGLAL